MGSIAHAWHVSREAWLAVAMAVVVNSVLKYGLTSFANKRAQLRTPPPPPKNARHATPRTGRGRRAYRARGA